MKKFLFLSVFVFPLVFCASSDEKDIERARFLLDDGSFDEVIALLQPIVDVDPNNDQAAFLLGSAYVGNFALAPKPGCQETDTGYLGTLACLLDSTSGSESGLQTFGRIAPSDNSLNNDIETALTLLDGIDTFSKDLRLQDVALQRLVGRAFAISTVFELIGANSENNVCNAGTPNTIDEVPDDYDSSSIDTPIAQAFQSNLEGIQQDADDAQLDADFEIFTRAAEILQDLEDTGLPIRDAVRTIFDNAYNSPEQQTCS